MLGKSTHPSSGTISTSLPGGWSQPGELALSKQCRLQRPRVRKAVTALFKNQSEKDSNLFWQDINMAYWRPRQTDRPGFES